MVLALQANPTEAKSSGSLHGNIATSLPPHLSSVSLNKCFLGNSCMSPTPSAKERGTNTAPTLGQSQGHPTRDKQRSQPRATGAPTGRKARGLPKEGPHGRRHQQTGWQMGPVLDSVPHWTLPWPQTCLIHTGVSSEKCQPVAMHSLQPPATPGSVPGEKLLWFRVWE